MAQERSISDGSETIVVQRKPIWYRACLINKFLLEIWKVFGKACRSAMHRGPTMCLSDGYKSQLDPLFFNKTTIPGFWRSVRNQQCLLFLLDVIH